MKRLQDLIDRIPSGLRRVIIAVIVLALLAVFFPLQQDVNRLNQPLPPLTATPAPDADGGSSSGSTGGTNANTSTTDSAGGSSTDSSGGSGAGSSSGGSSRSTLMPSLQPSATVRPTITPSPTLSPCGPEAGWVIYTVRSGDTLNGIAQLVGTTIETLVECNDLANPNALRVNQQLFVPALPSLFVTSTATPSITPTPSMTPTPRQ